MRILGLATAVPPGRIGQREAADRFSAVAGLDEVERRRLQVLFRHAGVRHRHCVVMQPGDDGGQTFYNGSDHGPSTQLRLDRYSADAPDLAAAAAVDALRESGRDAAEVTDLVVVSCTGFKAPGVDLALFERLGLPATCSRTMIGFMGCHGAINGLRTASAYARPGTVVLLVAVELCSLHLQYDLGHGQAVANALFADGAAAVVGSADGDGLRVIDTHSRVFPDTAEAMTWSIGDHGFQMTLDAGVPGQLEAGVRPWLEPWLSGHGLSIDDIGGWAIHPGGPRIVEAVQASLGLPSETGALSREVLAEHGNMSSPTVLFVLDRLRRSGVPGPYVAMAFGPGLTGEAALLATA